MSVALPELCVGEPRQHESLSVFPLFSGAPSPLHYLLSDEAIGDGTVAVTEVSEGGSVPDLLVENRGDTFVLFLEGEELVGAKQNRILNTSVLVAARSKTRIPVSCVERGRWRYKSRHFASGGTHSPSRLRHVLKCSVSQSLRESGVHRSNQSAVWAEVERQQEALGTQSVSEAMADTFKNHEDRLNEFRERIGYAQGAVGMAVAIGGKIVALDLFDKPGTCEKVWNRLLTGYVLDALEDQEQARQVTVDDVERLLRATTDMAWAKVASAGEGEEYRADLGDALHGSALTFQESPVHMSVVVGG